jgi:hypothetical protein
MKPTTPQQDNAVNFVSEFFGTAEVDDRAGELRDGSVRITGKRAGVARCRWLVMPDGTVPHSWDPDNALTRYRPGHPADDPQDAEDDPGDPAPAVLRTKTGRVLTDADIEALADEAERGYDVEDILRRRGPDDDPPVAA